MSVLLSYSMGSTIAIRITIWVDEPNSQSLNYAIKTQLAIVWYHMIITCKPDLGISDRVMQAKVVIIVVMPLYPLYSRA